MKRQAPGATCLPTCGVTASIFRRPPPALRATSPNVASLLGEEKRPPPALRATSPNVASLLGEEK